MPKSGTTTAITSPRTREARAGNVNSKVFVLLQDWSSHEARSKEFDPETKRLGYTEDEPTNKSLSALLRDNLGMRLDQVYATTAAVSFRSF